MIKVEFTCDSVEELHSDLTKLLAGQTGGAVVVPIKKPEKKVETKIAEPEPVKTEIKTDVMSFEQFRTKVVDLGKGREKVFPIAQLYCTSGLLQDIPEEKRAEFLEKVINVA